MLELIVREKLKEACGGKLCLEIYYAKASGEKKRYEIVPVSTRSKGGTTMLYGFDMATSKTKAFRIDRIVEASPMQRKPWPENAREQVGFPLELETSKEAVPTASGIKLKPATSQ
jgi:predicted DNA-binding transcriptional regulator YafY